jgi:hypothetical protein
MVRAALLIALSVGTAAFAGGPQPSDPGSRLHVRLNLPPEVPSALIRIMYVLRGEFGASAAILPSKKDQSFIEIPTSVGGKPAADMKIAAYLPGCENVTLEIPMDGRSAVEDLRCHRIGTQRMHGRIVNKSNVDDAAARVEVTYSTGWMCRFFHLADCMTPLIYIAPAEVRNGEFTLDLPDIARPSGGDAESFSMVLVQPGNKRSDLRALGSPEHSAFRARPSYEAETKFVAEVFPLDERAQ